MSALESDGECVFCQPKDRAAWQGAGLRFRLDDSPIVPGHALLITARHYPSTADLDIDLAAWTDIVDGELRNIYAEQFGAFTMFEHGRTGHCLRRRPGERLCHHMHVHYLPLDVDLGALAGFGQRETWQTFDDVIKLGQETDGYALTDGANVARSFFPVSHGLAPHHLRTCLASAVGAPERADWENFDAIPEHETVITESRRIVAEIAVSLEERLEGHMLQRREEPVFRSMT